MTLYGTAWRQSWWTWWVTDFLWLSDTPSDYSWQAGKVAAVNWWETALEFIDAWGWRPWLTLVQELDFPNTVQQTLSVNVTPTLYDTYLVVFYSGFGWVANTLKINNISTWYSTTKISWTSVSVSSDTSIKFDSVWYTEVLLESLNTNTYYKFPFQWVVSNSSYDLYWTLPTTPSNINSIDISAKNAKAVVYKVTPQ